MDFSAFTNTDLPDAGSWLHLEHPGNGLPLYLGKGNTITTEETDKACRVLVRGNRAEAVKRVIDARARAEELHAARFLRSNERDAGRLVTDHSKTKEQYQLDLLVASVADWENIVISEGEPPAPCTPENIKAALSHPSFMVSIFRRSGDEAALFTDAPTG